MPTVAELDALAEEIELEDYPAAGNKAEKLAALEAAGVDVSEPKVVYRLQLAEGYTSASFQADVNAVSLDEENSAFETSDLRLFQALSELPFLEVVE